MLAVDIHARFAYTSLYYFVLLSLWGFWRFFRKEGLHPSYWGALAIGELLLFVQGGLGAYLWIIGLRPARSIHILYGVVSLMAIPAVYMYTRGREERAEMLMYGTSTLIGAGLLMRAIMTAV